MIRVTLLKSCGDMATKMEFFIDTDCFSKASEVVKSEVENEGFCLDDYPITAMSIINVISVEP